MDDSRTQDGARQNPHAPIPYGDGAPSQRAADSWSLPEIQIPDATTIPLSSAGRPPRRTVSRRKLLVGAGAGAVGLGLLGTGAAAFLAHQQTENGANAVSLYSQDAAKIGHLLRRAGFGASPANLPEYL